MYHYKSKNECCSHSSSENLTMRLKFRALSNLKAVEQGLNQHL